VNHVYRLVWNTSLNAFVVAAENARGRGKSGSRASSVGSLLAAVLLSTGAANVYALGPTVLPSGYQVSAGSANISTSGNTLTVLQSTPRAAINWQNFSIGSNATVDFVQPNSSSVILNRVVGNDRSVIAGAMNANGQVFLLNSNGVLFTRGASVDVNGLLASTLNISDADFMAGRSTLTGTGGTGAVINLGTIKTADAGYVALLGSKVVNDGVISARLGTVAMAGGQQITLNFNGNSLLGVTVNQGTLDALVANKQAIYAEGGQVILTTQAGTSICSAICRTAPSMSAEHSMRVHPIAATAVSSKPARRTCRLPTAPRFRRPRQWVCPAPG